MADARTAPRGISKVLGYPVDTTNSLLYLLNQAVGTPYSAEPVGGSASIDKALTGLAGAMEPQGDSLAATNSLKSGALGIANWLNRPFEAADKNIFQPAVRAEQDVKDALTMTQNEMDLKDAIAAEDAQAAAAAKQAERQQMFAETIAQRLGGMQGAGAAGPWAGMSSPAVNPTSGFDRIRQLMMGAQPKKTEIGRDEIDQNIIMGLGGGLLETRPDASAGETLLRLGMGALGGKSDKEAEQRKLDQQYDRDSRDWAKDMAQTELTLERLKDYRTEANRPKIHSTANGTILEQTKDGKRVFTPFQANGFKQASLENQVINALFPGGKTEILGATMNIDPNEPLGIEQSILAELNASGRFQDFAAPILQNQQVQERLQELKATLVASGLPDAAVNDQLQNEVILLLSGAMANDDQIFQDALNTVNAGRLQQQHRKNTILQGLSTGLTHGGD